MHTTVWLGSVAMALGVVLGPIEGTAVAQKPPAAAAKPGTPSPADVSKAQSLFRKADALFNQKKYADALTYFKQSYQTVPSPNSHLYIARCMAQMNDPKGAYLEFQKVYDEADARAKTEPKYEPTRESAKNERDELAPKLALVTVNVANADATTTVRISGEDVTQERWGKPIPFMPGTLEIVMQGGGKAPKSQTLTVAGGERRDVSLDVSPPAVAEGPTEPAPASKPINKLLVGGIVAGGVGVIGLVTFIGAGAASSSTYSDLSKKCPGGNCPATLQPEVSGGISQQTAANVGLVIGGLGLATGAVLIVLSRREAAPAPAAATQGSTHLLVGPGFSGVSGTF